MANIALASGICIQATGTMALEVNPLEYLKELACDLH